MAARDKPKLYQVWKRNNRFLCGGRLIFGPDAASLLSSVFLIIGPAIAFCVKVYCIIRQHVIEGKPAVYWYPVLVMGFLLTVLDVAFLFITSSRDPGIIPRNTRPPESAETYDMNTPSMEWVNGRTPHLKLPRTTDVIVNGHAIKVKYCDTCLLYRPPRASHFSICNNCIQRFDHHCPWVGQCIGLLNYRFFYMFISTSTILCLYVFVFSWVNILQREGSLWRAISEDLLSDLLIVYCFVAVWFVGGLSVFHFYLIKTNQNFRYRYDAKENPYNRGILRNFKEVFLSKIPPSRNDFRALVLEDENMLIEPSNLNNIEDGTSSKEIFDIEMGTKLVDENGILLAENLRNLNCDDFENDVRSKDVKLNGSDPFPCELESEESLRRFSVRDEKTELEPSLFLVQHELKDFPGSSTAHNGVTKDQSFDGLSTCNESDDMKKKEERLKGCDPSEPCVFSFQLEVKDSSRRSNAGDEETKFDGLSSSSDIASSVAQA